MKLKWPIWLLEIDALTPIFVTKLFIDISKNNHSTIKQRQLLYFAYFLLGVNHLSRVQHLFCSKYTIMFSFFFFVQFKKCIACVQRNLPTFLQIRPNDILILGTDGLWDNIWDEEVIDIIKSTKQDAATLAQSESDSQLTPNQHLCKSLTKRIAGSAYVHA